MSPRRSSRARTNQLSPLLPPQTTSSNSSVASDRAQRATRANIKPDSPHRSVPRSQSQDEAGDDTPKPPPRRTRSGGTEIRNPSPAPDDNVDEEEDDGQDENEVTRCVCKYVDFPGMSSPLLGMLSQVEYTTSDGNAVGDFFVQCDACKVWQHGGCVGIVDQDHSPEEYYCEECEKDLHKVAMSPEGQRYSRYAPVMAEPPYRQSPKPGPRGPKGKEKPRQSTDTSIHKRRQTLNSRLDQEELEFQRAIEESKKTTAPQLSGSAADTSISSRPVKRTRDESYEYVTANSTIAVSYVNAAPNDVGIDGTGKEEAEHDGLTPMATHRQKPAVSNKRQRTDSGSPAHEPKPEEGSETEPIEAATESTPKHKIRGAAARNHQAKEAREAKERQRLAAANARQARSERRRGDESDEDGTKEEHIPSTAASSPPAEMPSSSRTAKKKPTPGRRGRTAKNQQNREPGSPGVDADDGLLSTNPHNTRARSRSRSVVRDDVDESRSVLTPNGTTGTRGGVGGRDATSTSRARDGNATFDDGGLLSKPSKVKNFNEKRTSMNEMRKRVAAISEFIGRAQVERPPSKSTSMSRSESEAGASGSGNTSNGNGNSNSSANSNTTVASDVNGTVSVQRKKELNDIIHNGNGQDFGTMNTEEMLENMRLRTRAWQELFGKYGDK